MTKYQEQNRAQNHLEHQSGGLRADVLEELNQDLAQLGNAEQSQATEIATKLGNLSHARDTSIVIGCSS